MSRYFDLLFTPAVKAAQEADGSRAAYARMEGSEGPDPLRPEEMKFIAARDSFYMATVTETGWPYLQHRGGPKGFVRFPDTRTLAFPDYRGNRQLISLGNASCDDRVSLFFMDYPNRTRLKLLGHMRAVSLKNEPELGKMFAEPEYGARIERVFLVAVEGYSWNCPQHITPRFTPEELDPSIALLQTRIAELEHALKECRKDHQE